MTWLDLIVIYFACGAPVAVNFSTRRPRPPVYRVLLSFLFWPAALAFSRPVPPSVNGTDAKHFRLENLRAELEELTFRDAPGSTLFSFRDVFYRYVSLADAASATGDANFWAEHARISGTPDPAIAAACHSRRARSRVAQHHERTRDEFIRSVDLLYSRSLDISIYQLAASVAQAVDDASAVSTFKQFASAAGTPSAPAVKLKHSAAAV